MIIELENKSQGKAYLPIETNQIKIQSIILLDI